MTTLSTAPPPRENSTRNFITGKPQPGFCRRAEVALLVGGGVGQLRRGTVHDFDRAPLQGGAWVRPSFGGLGGGRQCFFQPLLGQTLAGLDIGRIALLDGRFAVQVEGACTWRTTSRQAVLGRSICQRKHSKVRRS